MVRVVPAKFNCEELVSENDCTKVPVADPLLNWMVPTPLGVAITASLKVRLMEALCEATVAPRAGLKV